VSEATLFKNEEGEEELDYRGGDLRLDEKALCERILCRT
jgi:hypothetical protein